MAAVPQFPKSFEEAAQLRRDVEAELERICASPSFRTSRRSCQFLCYVVRVALDGRKDSLKERSIGMDLLHRDVSYDPSSDATVRVRANDVRKRLASFYGSDPHTGSIRISLAAGTYVPTFVHVATGPVNAAPVPPANTFAPIAASSVRSRSIRQLSRLAVIGLALCACLIGILAVHYSLEQQDACQRFWEHILTGKKVLLLSMSDQDRRRLASGLFPVVWIAGKSSVPTVLTSGSLTGATTATFAKVRISATPPAEWTKEKRLHWLLNAGEAPTLTILNPDGRSSTASVARTALLTILPESPSILYVQSTDEDSLRKIFETLTSSASFPANLTASSIGSTALQVLLIVDTTDHSIVSTWEPTR